MFSFPRVSIQHGHTSHTASERGAIAVEYAFLLALVFVVAVTAIALFGSGVVELYTDNSNRFATAVERSLG